MESISYNSSPEKGRVDSNSEFFYENFKEGSQITDKATLDHYLQEYQEKKKNGLLTDDQQSQDEQQNVENYLKQKLAKEFNKIDKINFSNNQMVELADNYHEQLKIGLNIDYQSEPKSPTFFKEKITANSQEITIIEQSFDLQNNVINKMHQRQKVCIKDFRKISQLFRDQKQNIRLQRQLSFLDLFKVKQIKKPKFTDDQSNLKSPNKNLKISNYRLKLKQQNYNKTYKKSQLHCRKYSKILKESTIIKQGKKLMIMDLQQKNGEIQDKKDYGFSQQAQIYWNKTRNSLIATVETPTQCKMIINSNIFNNQKDSQFQISEKHQDTQEAVFRKNIIIVQDAKIQKVDFNNEGESQKSMKRFHVQSKNQIIKDHIHTKQNVQYPDENEKGDSDDEADVEDDIFNHQSNQNGDNLRSSQTLSKKQKYFAQKKKKEITATTQNPSIFKNNSSSYEDQLVNSVQQLSAISQKDYLRNKQPGKQNQYYTSSEAETAAAKAHTMINSQNLSRFQSKLPLKMESHHEKLAEAKDLIQKPEETEEEQYSHSHDHKYSFLEEGHHQQLYDAGTQDQHIAEGDVGYPQFQFIRNSGWDGHFQQKNLKQIAHNESFPKFKKRIMRSYEVKKNNKHILFEFKKRKSLSCHNEKNINELTGGISNRNKKQSHSKIGLSDIKHNHNQFNEENFTQNKHTEKFAFKNNFSYNKTNDDCETLQFKMAYVNILENEPINEFKSSIISRTNKSIQYNPNEEGLHQSIISQKHKYKEVHEQHEPDQYQHENKNVQSKIFEFSQGLPTFRSNDFSLSNKNILHNFQQIEVVNVDQQDISSNLLINLQECKDSFTTSQKNQTTMNQTHDTKKAEFQNTNKKFTITKKVDIENQNRLKAVTFTNNDFSDQIQENELKQQILVDQNKPIVEEQTFNESPLMLIQKYKSEIMQQKSQSQIIPANEHHKMLNNEYNQTFCLESPELKDIQVKITNEDNQSFEIKAQNQAQAQAQKKFEIKKQNNALEIFRQQSVAFQKEDVHLNFPMNKVTRSNSMRELFMKDYNDPQNQYFINYEEDKQKTEMSNKQFHIENLAKFKQNRRQFMKTHQNIHDVLRSPFDNAKYNQYLTRTVRSSNMEEAGTSERNDIQYNFNQNEEMFKSINILELINDNYIVDNIDKRIKLISPIEDLNYQIQENQYVNREDDESIREEQKEFTDVMIENQSCPEKLERNTDGDLIREYNQQTGTQSLKKQYFEQVDIDSSSMAQVEAQILKNRVQSDMHLYQNQSETDAIKQQEKCLQKDLEITIDDVMKFNNNSANPEIHQSKLQPIIQPQIFRKSNLINHNQYQSDDQKQMLDIRDQEVEQNLQELLSNISNNLNEQVEVSRKINYSANNEKLKDKIDFEKSEVMAQIRKANSLYRIDQQLSPEKLISNENCLIDQQQYMQNESINDKIQINEIIDLNRSSEEANPQNYQQKTFIIQKSSQPYQLNEIDNSLSEKNARQNQVAMKIFKIENKDEINNINHSDGFIQTFEDKKFQLESNNLLIEEKFLIQKKKEDLKKQIQDQEFKNQQSFHQDENLQKINQSFDYQKNYFQKKNNKSQYLTGEKQGKQEINTSHKKVDSQKTFLKKQIYEDNIDEENMSENELQSVQSNQKFNNNYIKYENQKLRQSIQQIDKINQNNPSFSHQSNHNQNNFQQYQQSQRSINKQNEIFQNQQNEFKILNNQNIQNGMIDTPAFDKYNQSKPRQDKYSGKFNNYQQKQFEETGIFSPPFEQPDHQPFQNQQFHQFQIYKQFAAQKNQQQQNPFDFQYMNRFSNPSCHCQCQPNFQSNFSNINNYQNIQNQQQFNSEQNILSQMKNATINQINMNINYLKYIEQKEFQLKQMQDYQEFMEFQQFANRHK